MPPPLSPAMRKRSFGTVSPSNRSKPPSSEIDKSPSPGQIRSSSAMSETPSQYTKSDVFSAATKLEIKRLSGDSCWACETESPQIAYVIAKEDKQIPLWSTEGLLTFSLTSAANGIPLCPTCHVEFDRFDDPGFVFIPADLQYFIDFELKDSEKRALAAREGNILPREVPTSTLYRDHLFEQGIISDRATSGLYQPIFLKKYLLGGRFSPEEFGLAEPKHWHGAPLATLRRGILALGSGRICGINLATVTQLEMLRNLYFRGYRDCSPGVGNKPAQLDLPSGKRQRDDDKHSEPNKRTKRKDSAGMHEPGNTGGHHLNAQTYSRPALQRPQEKWNIGPQFTTEEIVKRYGYLLPCD
ncbi:unnamed protein product [Penicillium egyptiacum]|uniref:HNH nuclease domain-containing protein n=1 Tax=Penicillium egyptiacum TaxID=1303716 RepID=A0A9W4KCQ7_9EURO|nr:unnamed protein product [Penicillium egyptiacum]